MIFYYLIIFIFHLCFSFLLIEIKTESSALNDQDVIICNNNDISGKNSYDDNNVGPTCYTKSSSSSVSLSSLRRSASFSPSTSSHTSPLSEPSVHSSYHVESSSGHPVESDVSKQKEQNTYEKSPSVLSQSKQDRNLSHNDQNHTHRRRQSGTTKNVHSSFTIPNERYRSSPDLSNEKCHKSQPNETVTTTNNPYFGATGQELLENRMVGISE